MEINAALDPVNRWIVAGEPVVSEHEGATRVQGGDIEIHSLLLAGQEAYVQFNCLSDYGVTGTVNKMESDSGDPYFRGLYGNAGGGYAGRF